MVAAGSFYPADPDELKDEIKGLFSKKPYSQRAGFMNGLISPHAGYTYSGRTMARGFYELSKHEPRTMIIIGPSHSGLGDPISIMYNAGYKTPLGKVKTNQLMARGLCKSMGLTNDFLAHSHEHSVEVQLPFLQSLYGDKLSIVPIIIGDAPLTDLKRLGLALTGLDATIIVSSDFTHHGEVYGYNPFSNIKLELREHDMKAIELIQELRVDEFHALGEQSTICGYKPITVLLEAMKGRGAKSRFLEYSTSADKTKDYKNVVSYASIIFD
jgi:hypothetical protein